MLALTAYASSEEEGEDEDEDAHNHPSKRMRADDVVPSAAPSQAASLPPPPLPPPPLPPPPLPPPPLLLPPLPPPPLLDDEADGVSASTRDDGRVRAFDHVDGQFAVHVYIPLRLDAQLASSLRGCCTALEVAAAATGIKVHAIDDATYHLSLSRTVALQRPQIDGFADALRLALRRCSTSGASGGGGGGGGGNSGRRQQQQQQQRHPAMRVAVATTLCALPNDTHTRFFAALELRSGNPGHAAVNALIDAVDAVLARYGQPRFYAERRLHFSVAWSLVPLPSPLPPLPAAAAASHLLLDRIECRIGERVSTFPL